MRKEIKYSLLYHCSFDLLNYIVFNESVLVEGKKDSIGLDLVGIRLVKEGKLLSKECIKTSEQAIKILTNELKYLDREVLYSINLNHKNQIINAHLVSMGTINHSLIDPKSIFKASLLSNVSKIMLLHNHPTGNCIPSKEDYYVTEQLKNVVIFSKWN